MPTLSANLQWIARVLALMLVLEPGLAFAYIDPNTGGLFFQLLAPIFAGIVGAWMFLRRSVERMIKAIWHRVTGKAPH